MRFFKMAVAVDQQHHRFKSFTGPPRCRLLSNSHLDYTMPEFGQTNFAAHSLKQAFQVANIHRSFSTPCLSLTTRLLMKEEEEEEEEEEEYFFDGNPRRRIEIIGGHADPRTRALVVEVAIAMASGHVILVPVSSGLSGAYFLGGGRNNETIAVVKPIDEEPPPPRPTPQGFIAGGQNLSGMKGSSIRIGETGLRELAAYLLDHGGFAGVPPTALVKISHATFHHVLVHNNNNSEAISTPPPPPPSSYKIASLQRFVDHDSDAGDLGPSGFSVSSIHCIGILDVRLLNLDRHAGNMLVKRGGGGHESSYVVGAAELVPIDHGLCLPESLDDPYFEWLHWPQASVPFSESEVEYVLSLDPFKDAEILRNELPSIRESSIRVLMVCTIFMKRAVAAGLCLADIGEMMTREFGGEENLSVLENLCLNAKATMSSSSIVNGSNDNDYECEEEQTEIFQFESEDSFSQALDLPQLLQQGPPPPPPPPVVIGKPLRIARSMSGLLDAALMSPLHEEQVDHEVQNSDDCDINTLVNNSGGGNGSGSSRGNECYCKVGGLTRSKTFSVSNQNHENGGIIFGEMSEEEWDLFLENLEKLLPEVFEGRKRMSLMKQRLGTSCEF